MFWDVLSRFWLCFGQVLSRLFEQVLVIFWSGLGDILVLFWASFLADFGDVLLKCWAWFFLAHLYHVLSKVLVIFRAGLTVNPLYWSRIMPWNTPISFISVQSIHRSKTMVNTSHLFLEGMDGDAGKREREELCFFHLCQGVYGTQIGGNNTLVWRQNEREKS